MALRTPPSWLQQGSHPAENDRLTNQAIFATTGIVGSTSMAVTANGTPNMSVNVATGWAAIVSSTTNGGVYVCYNDATTNLTITAANASLARIDRVVVTVNDAYYSGSLNNVTFTVIAGTPAASPSAPATPSNSISLATIAVGAGVTTIVSGNITDTRVETTTNLPVGDITAVTAGTGLSGGGTSGAVTLSLATSPSITTPTISSASLTGSTQELVTTSGTGFAGYTYDAATQAIVYITANSTANGTVNIRGNSGTTLNTFLATNEALTLVLMITNGATPYYPNEWRIDSALQTVKWVNGTAVSAGNANSIDIYTMTIIKTASATYTVLGQQTKFA